MHRWALGRQSGGAPIYDVALGKAGISANTCGLHIQCVNSHALHGTAVISVLNLSLSPLIDSSTKSDA
jgi:hypothetical protein